MRSVWHSISVGPPPSRAFFVENAGYWIDEFHFDGLRLDAIPYLIEREGTICENLEETHTVIKKIRAALVARRVPCVAVSPLIGGRAVKGPADRMLARMAGGTTPEHVASCYAGLIDALVVDESDPAGPVAVRRVVTRTLMTDLDASRRLAETVLGAAA